MNSINLFNGLDKNQIEEFNSLCTIKRFESKSLIIRDNTKINGVYILKTGISGIAVSGEITRNFNTISTFNQLLKASSTAEQRYTFE